MGEARCGGLLFCCDPALLCHDLTPDSCIFKMLNPHKNEGLGTIFAVDGRNQTHANGYATANSSMEK